MVNTHLPPVKDPGGFCISTPVVLYQKPGNDMYQDPDKISAQDPYFFVSGPRGLSHKESQGQQKCHLTLGLFYSLN